MNYVDTADQTVSLSQIVRQCPGITLRRAFTRAYRDWAGQTQYLRTPIIGATVAGTVQYSLGSDPYVEIMGIDGIMVTNNNGAVPQYWPLAPSDSSMWNPAIGQGQPVRYCYVPQAQFGVNPTPNAVYALTVSAIIQPKEGAAQVPEDGLTKYRSGIEAGTLAYLLTIPGQVWTDQKMAMVHRAAFQSSINNARADVQRAFNTGSVRIRPRAFVR